MIWWRAARLAGSIVGAMSTSGPTRMRPAHGELRDDLTPHRVRDQDRAGQAHDVEPVAERVGQIADARRRGRPASPAAAGQVGDVRGALGLP